MNKRILCAVFTPIFCSFIAPVSALDVLGEAKLETMEKPLARVSGSQFHWLRDGKEHIVNYEAVDAELTKARDSVGCSWTEMTDMFAPTLAFNNCDGVSGTHKITETKGNPWPLSAESEFQYSFSGQLAGFGNPWSDTRKCEVDGQERIKVPAGEYDTYKIICKETRNVRTYWVSPELGYAVAIKRKNYRDNSKSYMMELVKTVNP